MPRHLLLFRLSPISLSTSHAITPDTRRYCYDIDIALFSPFRRTLATTGYAQLS